MKNIEDMSVLEKMGYRLSLVGAVASMAFLINSCGDSIDIKEALLSGNDKEIEHLYPKKVIDDLGTVGGLFVAGGGFWLASYGRKRRMKKYEDKY